MFAGIAGFTAGGIGCAANFGVLVVGCVYITVLNLAYLADSLVHTGGFSTGMMCFINDIAAADSLTLFPVIGFIRCPNRRRVMSVFAIDVPLSIS